MVQEERAVSGVEVAGEPPRIVTKSRVPWYAKVCIALVLLCGTSGFFHFVYGGSVGFTVCLKDGWAMSNTFVDLDEIVGKPLLSQLHRAPTLRALIAAGIIDRPKFGRDR